MRFLGTPYPITKNPKGFLYTQEGLDQIKSDLLVLLMTYPGERVMLPGFGTPLKDLLFDQNDVVVAQKASQMIARAISAWEPRITVTQIDVMNSADESSLNPNDTKTEAEHVLSINIRFFDPQNIKDVQQLKLELPLGGT
jgi:phage baseplate assembly protein W